MKKFSKIALSFALVLSMTIPTAIVFAEDEVEIPEAVAAYRINGDEEGTMEAKTGATVATDDTMGTVLHLDASTAEADSEAVFTNPFVGLDLFEQDVTGDNYEADEDGMPLWYEGVVINYWIKTADTTNSVILNFRNGERMQVQKDDWRKHIVATEAQAAYDKAAETGEPIAAAYALGEKATYIDESDKEYVVYSSIGTYGQYNPDYEVGYKAGDNGTLVRLPNSDPDLEESYISVVTAGEDMYERFYDYNYETNKSSMARQGLAKGFFQLSLDGSICFTEDDGTATNINPNCTGSNLNYFNIMNNLNLFGSSPFDSTTGESAMKDTIGNGEWHMVTVVIQNDWISYYLDGEIFDSENEMNYFGTAIANTAAGKSFNAGFGLRYPFQRGPSARTDYLSGNRAGTLLVEWLGLDGTTFSVGGTNAIAQNNSYRHSEKVAEFSIDDITFYDSILDEDQIYALYDDGVAKMESGDPDKYFEKAVEPTQEPVLSGDVNEDKAVNAKDALAILKHSAKMEVLSEDIVAACDTNGDGKLDAQDALNVLKFAANVIDKLPVE